MPDFDEERFKVDVSIPSEQQVQRAAKLMCIASGRALHEWVHHQHDARGFLIILMNKAKWQIAR